jgi:hypothetical protein
LYPTDLTAADIAKYPSVFDCDTFMPNRGNQGFGYVGGGTSGSQTYPTGVAWHFDAGQVVMLESHMLNLDDTPLDVDYRVNLWYATEPVTEHVGTIFFYDNDMYIPPGGRYTANMHCGVPADIHVVSLAPHMHVRGTHFTSSLSGSPLAAPMPLVSSDDWAAIEPTRYSPPLDVAKGQQFDVSCDYVNPDPKAIASGPSKTNNEMCLLIGSYYPKQDFPFEFCSLPGSGPTYDGTATCADTFACFTKSGDPFGVEAQKCVTNTCKGSSQAFDDFFNCAAQKCFFPGKCGGSDGGVPGSDCAACTVQECAQEISACQQATCP